MRPAIIILLSLAVIGCKERSSDKQGQKTDTAIIAGVAKDTATKAVPHFHTSPDEDPINQSLKNSGNDEWHVLNDREAKWIKDAFEYFIVPKRKEEPNYPYISFGDYNGDGKQDTAAVVTNDDKNDYRIAILLSDAKPQFWKEDVLVNAALSTVPKGSAVEGGTIDHPMKIKLKIDGINVEYFEQASFVVYLSGKAFKRIQQGD